MKLPALKIPFASPRVQAFAIEWFLPVLLSSFLIARCAVQSFNRRMWADELFSWYPANASFGTMLSSTADTINAAPPLYFILSWFWSAIFGGSPLVLRLFSTLAIVAALFLMFAVLRRAYGRLAASAALLVAFSHPDLLYASSEARFHSLIVAEIALGLLLFQRIAGAPRPSLCLLAGNTALHAALVMTHYMGLFYSGVLLAGFFLSDVSRFRNPLRASLSVLIGWLAFLPWLPVFFRHSAMGKPTFWIPIPTTYSLKMTYSAYVGEEFWLLLKVIAGFGILGLLGFVLAVFLKRSRAASVWQRFIRRRELPLLIMAPCLLAVPLVVYYLSIRPDHISFYHSRYFVSGALGVSILYAHLISRCIELYHLRSWRVFRRTAFVLQALLLITATVWTGSHFVHAVSQGQMGKEPRPQDFPASYTTGDPVVVEHIHEFLKVGFYSRDPHRYAFLVDPEVGIAEGEGGPLNHTMIAAMKRQFPEHFSGVHSSEEFLRSAKSFWVKRSAAPALWYTMRIQNNPDYAVDQMEDGTNLVHFVRITPRK